MKNIFNWAKGRFSGAPEAPVGGSPKESDVADDVRVARSADEAYDPTVPNLRVLNLSKSDGAADDDSEGYDPYDTTVIMNKKQGAE